MCKKLCTCRKPDITVPDWQVIKRKKPTRLHWVVLFVVLCLWSLWMAQDISGIASGIEYNGVKAVEYAAIEISGVDFVSEEIKSRDQSLSLSMHYQCNSMSEDVLFAFQFSFRGRPMEDHLFHMCDKRLTLANTKVVHRSGEKIKCTEEYDGVLKHVVRSKQVTVKAIDVDNWRQVEYTSADPKEACTIQHAIDVLELKWV